MFSYFVNPAFDFALNMMNFALKMTLSTSMQMRAWEHTEEAKRRTLQRQDVRTVVTDVDVMDFLMDIVPAEEAKVKKEGDTSGSTGMAVSGGPPQMDGMDLSGQLVPSGAGPLYASSNAPSGRKTTGRGGAGGGHGRGPAAQARGGGGGGGGGGAVTNAMMFVGAPSGL